MKRRQIIKSNIMKKEIKKTTDSVSQVSKTLVKDVKGISKLPWKNLPLKGFICLAIPLILIFALIFIF